MPHHHDLEQRAHVEQVEGVEDDKAGALEVEAAVLQRDQEGGLEGRPYGGGNGGRQESVCGERQKGALALLL